MSSEEATADTNGTLIAETEDTGNNIDKETVDVGKTDDEKEIKDKINEETEDRNSPFPEYSPGGSQVSLKNGDNNSADGETMINGDAKIGEETGDSGQNTKEAIVIPAVDMSQTETQADPDIKKAEESSESTNKDLEPKTEETTQSNDSGEASKEAEKTDDTTENTDVEKKDEEKKDEDEEVEKDAEKKKDDKTDGVKEEEAVVTTAGGVMATEEMEKKIKENEELQNKLESALSNQEAQRDAYQKLVDENARLQKHHDDMKAKFEEMEGGHVLLAAELETFKKVNEEQKETIAKQQNEIKVLKETQGGDDTVKDLQDKLIRLSNEQEEKDKRIHSLEGELDATKDKLKDAESKASRNGNAQGDAPKSKTCIVM